MYREVARIPRVNLTVKEVNDYCMKAFGVPFFTDLDVYFGVRSDDQAMLHSNYILEVDGMTIIYKKVLFDE